MKKGTGLRFNKNKTRHDLVPSYAQEQYAKVLTAGAEKYSANNWKKGMDWSKVVASMKRHILAFENGEDYDKETGLLHMAHVMCNSAFLVEYYKIFPQGDDRSHNYLETPKIGLDIDEVLCDWVGGYAKKFDACACPRDWYFSYKVGENLSKMEENGEIDEFYLNLERKIDPRELNFTPHCYITSRSVDTEITKKWLIRNGFPSRPVYTVGLGGSKVDVCRDSGIDIFVDDNFNNFVELNNAGICTFLMDSEHNRKYDVGFKRLRDLNELLG